MRNPRYALKANAHRGEEIVCFSATIKMLRQKSCVNYPYDLLYHKKFEFAIDNLFFQKILIKIRKK